MRLTELEPNWIGHFSDGSYRADGKRFYLGISFICPCCKDTRLAVMFDNPVNDGVVVPHWGMPTEKNKWRRSGETFECLTLTPSIDASGAGHWHGFITNGEVK